MKFESYFSINRQILHYLGDSLFHQAHCIQKKDDDFDNIKEYIKMSSKWADIKDINKFNSQIAKAQSA